MEKIKKFKEASVPIIAIVVIIIFVLLAITLIVFATPDGTWDTPWELEDGIWEEQILIEFEDGSIQPLKLLEDNENNILGTVKYNGQVIKSIHYEIYATASGTDTDFTQCEITSFSIVDEHKDSGGSLLNTYTRGVGPFTININQRTKLGEWGPYLSPIYVLKDKPPGTYTLSFHIKESYIGYRGLPNGEWKTTSPPPGRTITLTVEAGTLQLNMDSGSKIYYP